MYWRGVTLGTLSTRHVHIAKPEHNGKRARVVSFDARTGTGRYAVVLDDGKKLSLKAECVARAGCAAAAGDARRPGRSRSDCCKHLRMYALLALSWPKMLCRMW